MSLPALLPLLPLLAWAATPLEPAPALGSGLGPVPADPPLPAQPPDALFAAGAEAYARGDWPAVVLQMERALRARAAVRSRLVRCRLRCANDTAGPAEGADPVLRDLLFFRGLLRRAACLRGCGPAAPSRYRLGDELDREFSKRSPYNYLQVAYFKVRDRRRDRKVGGGCQGAAGPAAIPGKEGGCPGGGSGAVRGMPGGIPGGRIRGRAGNARGGSQEQGMGPRELGGAIPGRGGVPGPGGVRPGVVGVWDGGPGPCPSLPARPPPQCHVGARRSRPRHRPRSWPRDPPAAAMPRGRGSPPHPMGGPRHGAAVSHPRPIPSCPDEPAGAGGSSGTHLLRGQPRAPGDEAEPGVLPSHGGCPRG